VALLEAIRDVLEEDKAEDDVLVFGRVNVLRSLSAASQSFASKPMLAEEFALAVFPRAICEAKI
jgi:hypothetical protein